MDVSFDFSKNIKGIKRSDSDYYLNIDDDNDFYSEDFDPNDKKRFKMHEGIIFLVEVTGSLLTPYEWGNGQIGKPPITDILDSLNATIEQLTITLPNTGIGLYVFNTSQTDSDSCMKCVFPLRDINVKDMKLVHELIEDMSSNSVDLFQEWGPLDQTNDTSNASVLVQALSEIVFKFKKENLVENGDFNKKKVFLFTDNDNPEQIDSARCRIVLNDLVQNNIEFNPFLISAGDRVFDSTKFYDEIAKKLDHGDILDVASIRCNLLKEKVLKKKEIERRLFFCPLYLNEETCIGVTGYLTFQQEKPQSRSRMYHSMEKTDAKSKRQYLLEKTGEDVTDKTTECYELFNKKTIAVKGIDDRFQYENDPADLEPFLKVVGFSKNSNIFSYFLNVDKPCFIVPDETELKGSTRAFTALYKSMFKQNKSCLLIGKLKRAGSIQNYMLTIHGTNGTGFYLYKIPSKEEIRLFPNVNRNANFNDKNEEYTQMRKLSGSILKRITMKNAYNPQDYKNPEVQKYYRILRDFLLQVEIEEDQEGEDSVKPDPDDTLSGLQKTLSVLNNDQECQKHIQQWLELYNTHKSSQEVSHEKPAKITATKKRKTAKKA